MFVNCKHCNALVATDPVTDLPPERCPRCAGVLRLPQAAPVEAAPDVDAPATDAPTPEPLAQAAPTPPPETTAADEAPSAEAAPAAALPDAPAPAAAAASPASDPAPVPAPVDSAPTDDAAPPAPALLGDKSYDAANGTDAPAEVAAVAEVAEVLDPASDVAAAPAQAPADTPAAGVAAAADAPTVVATPPADPAVARTESTAAGPGFLSRTAPAAASPAGARRWLLPAAIASLALLLALQVLLADRDRLAADAQWRPLVASVCGLFGCSLPAWHEPAAFALLAREVRPHPDTPGALRVSATFRNDARWTQDWPRLVLTLSDVDGRPVAARAFGADEYLASTATATGLDPGQTADIALDIREPSAATVSYAFDFR